MKWFLLKAVVQAIVAVWSDALQVETPPRLINHREGISDEFLLK